MTVGALFLPMGMPVLLSDSLVVWKNGNFIHRASRPEVADHIKGAAKASLVRKAFFLEDGLAVLYAGKAKDIYLAQDILSESWRERSRRNAPLAERLDILQPENLNPYNVSAILVYANSGKFWQIGSNAVRTETSRFGSVLTIGSGGEEFLRQTLDWQAEISHMPITNLTFDSSHLISEFVGAHRNRKLFFSQQLNSEEHWGGYLEVFIQDFESGRWLQTPDWVHLVCRFSNGQFVPGYPYYIYKRCDDGVQRLFKLQPGSSEVWEIGAKATQQVPVVDKYFGPFGPNAKITISVIDNKAPMFHHATSYSYQDGRFPTNTPEVCEYLDDYRSLFDEMGTNFRTRRGKG